MSDIGSEEFEEDEGINLGVRPFWFFLIRFIHFMMLSKWHSKLSNVNIIENHCKSVAFYTADLVI